MRSNAAGLNAMWQWRRMAGVAYRGAAAPPPAALFSRPPPSHQHHRIMLGAEADAHHVRAF